MSQHLTFQLLLYGFLSFFQISLKECKNRSRSSKKKSEEKRGVKTERLFKPLITSILLPLIFASFQELFKSLRYSMFEIKFTYFKKKGTGTYSSEINELIHFIWKCQTQFKFWIHQNMLQNCSCIEINYFQPSVVRGTHLCSYNLGMHGHSFVVASV